MAVKLKKTKSAGRYGPRYGRRVRAKLVSVESKQRLKQICPFCGKAGTKRLSKGIWKCSRKKCNKKFASDVYYLSEDLVVEKTLPIKKEKKQKEISTKKETKIKIKKQTKKQDSTKKEKIIKKTNTKNLNKKKK